MKLRKQSIIVGAIGLFLGGVGGYFYADHYNRVGPAAPGMGNTQMGAGQLPPGHPEMPQVDPAQIEAATKAADEKAQDFDAQLSAAQLLYRAGRFEDAAKYFERAHKLKPDDYDVIVQIGNAHFDQGMTEIQQEASDHASKHFVEAAQWYEQALKKKPDDVNVRTDYGLTFYFRQPQELTKAIEQYRRSLQVDPMHRQTLANLTIALAEQGNLSEAQATLAKLEEVAPGSELLARTLFSVTQDLMKLGKWQDAESTLAKLEKIIPGAPIIEQLKKDIAAQSTGERIQPH